MMSENSMTVIALETDSESGPDEAGWTSAVAAATGTASDSDAAVQKMLHWSEALRQSPHCDLAASSAVAAAAATAAAGADPTTPGSDEEEKLRLVAQIAELQSTLDDLSQRVETVKEENLKLSSENRILGQYIENLMTASSVFATGAGSPKAKRRGGANRRGSKPQ